MMATDSTASRPAVRDHAVTLREADGEEDAYYLQRLWHHWFGGEYDSQETLQLDLFPIADWTIGDDVELDLLDAYGVIAEHTPADRDATVRVGGGIVSLFPHDQTVKEIPAAASFDAEAIVGDTNAWFAFNVVDQAWRGQGIGRELLAHRLAWAREQGADMAFACGWEREDEPTSRPLLEAAGFVPVERIDAMYSDTERQACPDCGVWPSDDDVCQCDATFWALDLDTGGSA